MERFVTVYAFDDQGIYIGETKAQKDKNDNIMMPAQTTLKQPLNKEGHIAVFNGDRWYYRMQVIETPDPEPEKELTYAEKRMSEYPIMGDQLDAIFKGFKFMQDSGALLPNETADWLNEIDSIKTKYPKDV